MENVIISCIFLVLLLIVFWQLGEIKKFQGNALNVLKTMSDSIDIFNEYAEQSNRTETNTIHALQEICKAINEAFQAEQGFMNHSSAALHNIILCMIPFIEDIRECAVEDENFEKAQECIKIIANLKLLVNAKES